MMNSGELNVNGFNHLGDKLQLMIFVNGQEWLVMVNNGYSNRDNHG